MFCKGCGSQILENARFCEICGTPLYEQEMAYGQITEVKQKKKKGGAKSLLIALLALIVGIGIGVLVTSLVGGSGSKSTNKTAKSGKTGRYEGNGFDTTEEAVTAYLEAFSNGDIDEMYKCWAIESSVDNFTIYDSVERLKVYTPTISTRIPVYGTISRNLSIDNRKRTIGNTMIYQYMMFMNWSEDAKTMSIALEDDTPEEFIKEMFPNNEDKMEKGIVIDKIYNLDDLEEYELVKKADEKNIGYYHAEDMTSVPVVFHIGDDYYFWAAGLIKYDGKWYLDTNAATLSMIRGYPISDGNMEYIGNYSSNEMVLEMIK